MEFASHSSKKPHQPFSLFGILPEELQDSAIVLSTSIFNSAKAPGKILAPKRSLTRGTSIQSSGVFLPRSLIENNPTVPVYDNANPEQSDDISFLRSIFFGTSITEEQKRRKPKLTGETIERLKVPSARYITSKLTKDPVVDGRKIWKCGNGNPTTSPRQPPPKQPKPSNVNEFRNKRDVTRRQNMENMHPANESLDIKELNSIYNDNSTVNTLSMDSFEVVEEIASEDGKLTPEIVAALLAKPITKPVPPVIPKPVKAANHPVPAAPSHPKPPEKKPVTLSPRPRVQPAAPPPGDKPPVTVYLRGPNSRIHKESTQPPALTSMDVERRRKCIKQHSEQFVQDVLVTAMNHLLQPKTKKKKSKKKQ